MNSKIAFVTTSHSPLDDRIYYHQATALVNKGYPVCIISCMYKENANRPGPITIVNFDGNLLNKRDKLSRFREHLGQFGPEIIICAEPLAILAAISYKRKYKKKSKIIYDVTEWYPSKKNLTGLNRLKKISAFCSMLFFNFFLSSFVNGFIFGEYYKSLPYKLLFPFKNNIIISYYPDLKYIHYQPHLIKPDAICLGYLGKITAEKGIDHFLNVIAQLNRQQPALKVNLKIIGWFPDRAAEINYRNRLKELSINHIDELNFQDFTVLSEKIKEVDVFFDLRVIDFENKYCLPIKLFYYMACGRPVIYSDLKAIARHIDITQFGHAVDPADSEQIAALVTRYVTDHEIYYQHCLSARENAVTKYNWEIIAPDFLKFIALFKKTEKLF